MNLRNQRNMGKLKTPATDAQGNRKRQAWSYSLENELMLPF